MMRIQINRGRLCVRHIEKAVRTEWLSRDAHDDVRDDVAQPVGVRIGARIGDPVEDVTRELFEKSASLIDVP